MYSWHRTTALTLLASLRQSALSRKSLVFSSEFFLFLIPKLSFRRTNCATKLCSKKSSSSSWDTPSLTPTMEHGHCNSSLETENYILEGLQDEGVDTNIAGPSGTTDRQESSFI